MYFSRAISLNQPRASRREVVAGESAVPNAGTISQCRMPGGHNSAECRDDTVCRDDITVPHAGTISRVNGARAGLNVEDHNSDNTSRLAVRAASG
jgi:hypothetical protein